MRKIIAASIWIVLITISPVLAQDITLSWDPSPESNVIGYKVYYKSGSSDLPFDGSGAVEGSSPIDVGDTLITTISGLPAGQAHYFAVTAYDAQGLESSFSNIVASAWSPELLSPQEGSEVDPGQVIFAWSPAPAGTNATYTLYYGTDPALQNATLAQQNFATSPLLAGAFGFGLLGLGLACRRRSLLAPLCMLAALSLTACGGGGGGSSSTPALAPETSPGTPIPAGTSEISALTTTSYTATDLQPATRYYWKIVATDAEGNSYESASGSFVTGPN